MAVTMRSVGSKKINMQPTYYGPKVDTRNYLTQKLRVCAYCRVSTEFEEQQSSFDTQVQFYTMYINSNPNWELVGIYADDGVSGSQIYWRNGFSKMIEDAKAGKFDLVLTKSFTRFARNTVDSVETVRLFSSLGIDIYFEDKSLHSLDQKGEMMVTLYSAFAQEELRNLSENVAWGYQKSFARGEVLVTGLYGYKSKDKVVTIIEHEARTVRFIYKLFLEGYSLYQIRQELEAKKIPTKSGKGKWTVNGVKSILTNEKYAGNALCQKTITVDFLTKTRVKNTGQKKQYYVQNSHPAIISNEVFLAVQNEFRHRELLLSKKRGNDNESISRESIKDDMKYSGKYHLSNILFCEGCGSPYRRRIWSICGKKKIVWICRTRLGKDGRTGCPTSPSIEEHILHQGILRALNKAKTAANPVHIEDSKEFSEVEVDGIKKASELELQLNELKKELNSYMDTQTDESLIEAVLTEISIVEVNLAYYKYKFNVTESTKEEMNSNKLDLSKYSDDLAREYIDRIELSKSGVLKLKLKTGIEVSVSCNCVLA